MYSFIVILYLNKSFDIIVIRSNNRPTTFIFIFAKMVKLLVKTIDDFFLC